MVIEFEQQREIDQICEVLKQRGIIQSVDEIIYHYTSHKGLYGILESGKLRATNYSFLNDYSEIKIGSKIIKDVINDYKNNTDDKNRLLFLTNLEAAFFSKLLLSNVYVLCFSQEENLLSQWRAYGSKYGRVCIGFRSKDLIEKNKNFILSKVEYNEIKQKKIISQRIDDFCKLLPRIGKILKPFEFENALNPYYENISNILIEDISFFKHKSFDQEKEVRAIFWIEDSKNNIEKISFNATDKNIIPYLNLIVGNENEPYPPKLPVSTIWLGPSLNKKQLSETLPLILYKFGYDLEVEIKISDTPFQDQN